MPDRRPADAIFPEMEPTKPVTQRFVNREWPLLGESQVRVFRMSVNGSLSFFPLHMRRDLVRNAAHDLDRHHGEEAVRFWKATCRALGADLVARGCPEDEMRMQIMDFQVAVQMELMELHREQVAQG